jgi:trimethylamine--corrinoid protein Co-methyltransferase
MLRSWFEILQPLDVNGQELALDAILKVPPGGHFFGETHTLERYETAFHDPVLSDWRNFEAWEEDGSRTATERAGDIWKQLLAEYERPPIDPAIEQDLNAFIARRKTEIEANGL